MDTTTKAAHTPGPWTANVENCGGGLNVAGMNGQRIAHTAEYRAQDGAIIITEEAKANARLIAAAPELLEACKAMRRSHGMHGPCKSNNCSNCDWAYKQARAAIEKAEGNA